ncbi:MAG TPA: HD domain-containing phosphohydrolase, partial [Nocardioidaceae bacterium]|nr:HD domain-containing phosphohydrolase [Nocardioidaceae bacterium]
GVQDSLRGHCQVTGQIARRLGLGPEVCEPLQQVFARWDGKGLPRGLRGEDIALPIRVWHLADVAEVHQRRGGVDAAVSVARERRGGQFDPTLVDAFVDAAEELFSDLPVDSAWADTVHADPGLGRILTQSELDRALEVIADYADLKSSYFGGHSRGVADLAVAAGRLVGVGDDQLRTLRRAALVHDVGRTGVPNTIWDKPGALTMAEYERVRLHAYYTERMLVRPAALAEIGAVAALAHERLDGSGYHRGLPALAIPTTGRVLAAADAYHAMLEPRPHREPLSQRAAADALQAEARAGRLDARAVDAVLMAAGHTGGTPAAPAGLTAREVDVLVLLSRGASNKQVARRLGISPKTVGNHVEHIYAKAGVTTRSAATLFAMQHGLLRSLDPLG